MAKQVVILGGGVAGMSAAHELAERGFAVDIYEWGNVAGGKARSIPVLEPGGTTVGGRVFEKMPHRRGERRLQGKKIPWLPGEHGFRFFASFYRHIIDTMDRIPYGNGKVSDNLVDTTEVLFARYGGDSIVLPSSFPKTPEAIRSVLQFILRILRGHKSVPPDEVAFFLTRVWQIITSCEDRRLHEYEKIGWWDFIGAGERSADYQKYFAHGFTRSLVASQAQLASAFTVGNMHLQMLFGVTDPTVATADRLLNGPTNDVWIDPWLNYLEALGVRYHMNCDVQSVLCSSGVVRGATIKNRQSGVTTEVTGDYYIGAVPVEQMARLLTPRMIDTDPRLGHLSELAKHVEWMNGIQFYLTRPLPIVHGHVIYLDSPWALTSVSQGQFWTGQLSQYSDGDTREIISVDISDWNTPGHNNKPARECNFAELKEEVWEQLTRSLNAERREVLSSRELDSWFLDPDIIINPSDPEGLDNTEPLLVNLKDSWRLRPEAVSAIPNFFLASDYVRTYTDLATMEGANEAARRAVNGIIVASGSTASLCPVWKLHEPEIFQPFQEYDRIRWEAGLPWDDRWVSVALSILGLLQKAVGTSAGENEPVLPLSGASHISGRVGYRDVAKRLTEEDSLLKISQQLVSLMDGTPLLSAATGEPPQPQRRALAEKHPQQHQSSSVPISRRRHRIRIVQRS